MLAKVIALKAKSGFSVKAVVGYIAGERAQQDAPELHSSDPTAVADYVSREGVSEGGSFNLECLDPSDPQDRSLIVAQMDHVARAGQHKTSFKSNPFYHFVLSWREGEHPDQEQAGDAVSHTLKALGMQDNQAIFAIHRDKEHHHHVHVVVNRVNPDTLTLSGPPRYDFLVLDRACREIELAQGWKHDLGPYAVIDGGIQRIGRAQREKLGMTPGKSPEAWMMESKSGLPSLATWAKAYVAHELVDCQTWEDIHITMAKRGMRLEKLKSGLQVVALDADGKETRTKASAIDYQLSLGRLEKRMGAYRDFQPTDTLPVPALTYSRHLENVMRGVEPAAGEIPGKTGKSAKRDERRQEREAARNALYERYASQKKQSRDAVARQRQELSQRHKTERQQLNRQLSARKTQRVSELAQQHGKQVALALWAAERAKAQQELQARQQTEKTALKTATDMSWRAWVEREATAGDRAAEAALRGVHYREQRKRKPLPGFEGEDLEDTLESAPSARGEGAQKEVQGIGGTVKPFDLSRFEIDRLRQTVTYRDDQGNVALEDRGQRIECRQHGDEAVIRAGLTLASQKYGGEVFITGDDTFKARAAEIARQAGIRVANTELQRAGNQRGGQWHER